MRADEHFGVQAAHVLASVLPDTAFAFFEPFARPIKP
eukprot:COSAG01_NODE_26132_length_722_cov_13.792937_1_plen_36_part_10